MTDREQARQYLEDYAAGQIYRSARMTIDKDQIIAFAGQFDPQPYHLDEEAAHKSVFGGLAGERLAYRCARHAIARRQPIQAGARYPGSGC